MPTCKYCQKDFNRARDTKIYCSDRCRLYSFRKVSVTPKDISVTIEPVSVTDVITEEDVDWSEPEELIEELNYDESESNTRAEDWDPEKDF